MFTLASLLRASLSLAWSVWTRWSPCKPCQCRPRLRCDTTSGMALARASCQSACACMCDWARACWRACARCCTSHGAPQPDAHTPLLVGRQGNNAWWRLSESSGCAGCMRRPTWCCNRGGMGAAAEPDDGRAQQAGDSESTTARCQSLRQCCELVATRTCSYLRRWSCRPSGCQSLWACFQCLSGSRCRRPSNGDETRRHSPALAACCQCRNRQPEPSGESSSSPTDETELSVWRRCRRGSCRDRPSHAAGDAGDAGDGTATTPQSATCGAAVCCWRRLRVGGDRDERSREPERQHLLTGARAVGAPIVAGDSDSDTDVDWEAKPQ